MKLFDELKRRNVFRVAVGYAIAAWFVLQLTDVLMGLLELPSWVGRFAFFAVLLGFPLALAFSWVFQLTPEGLKRDNEIAPSESATAGTGTGRKLDLAIIVLLVISLGYFVVDKLVFTETATEEISSLPDWYEKSIAVLPFDTKGDEEEGGLFAGGIHDDLLTQLTKIADLHVISRTSVMEYADMTPKMTEIGAELGVRYILEGGVQKVGNQVRVNTQLIDAPTDKHLWAETFDRELTVENIFKVQSEIVQKITNSLHATLLPETEAAISRVPTNDIEAYRDYTAARLGNFSRDVRIELLQSAVERDPQFTLAWTELSYWWQQIFWFDPKRPDALEQSLQALSRAEAIDPDLPELHLARAIVQYHGFLNYEKALSELELAEQGLPGNSKVFQRRGWIYRHMGRLPEAIEALQRAVSLDPRSYSAVYNLAVTFSTGRYYQDAREVLESAITTFPDRSPFIRWHVAMQDWYQYGDSRSLLGVLTRPDWPETPRTARTEALIALSAWLADDMETALHYARLIDLDDPRLADFATPPVGMYFQSEYAVNIKAAILIETGAVDEADALLVAQQLRLTQELSQQSDPYWWTLQDFAIGLALMGEREKASEMAKRIVKRFHEEPSRAIPEESMRAGHGMIMCLLGNLPRAEEDFRSVLSGVSGGSTDTLASLVNAWPPCRDVIKGTEHYRRLNEEFGHLSQGKTLN